ncbi:hypothetical protein lerEdw1_018706 [Lerista edwardsae]|nr:hypothetical protein lerEdw1_018706 [Lerista edwardsae]
MEGRRRSIYSLSALCCLFAGALLPLPGDGQNSSSALPTIVPHLSHSEAGNLSIWTTAPAVTSVDGNPTITSQENASTSSPPEPSVSVTVISLNITAGPQNTDHATNSSVDTALLPTPTANQSSLDDAKPASTVSWAISSTTFMATEPFQSKETRGPTATSHSNSSIFTTLGPTEERPETMPGTDHEVITEENTAESTSAAGAVVTESRVSTLDRSTTSSLTPEAVSTLSTHSTAPVETEQAANHVQEKIPVSDVEGYGEDQPSMPTASSAGEDPLVIAVIFIFIMTVGILAFMGFLRYRQRSSRLQFRRLQDLPMRKDIIIRDKTSRLQGPQGLSDLRMVQLCSIAKLGNKS